MPALANLCAARGSRLTWHTPSLPDRVREKPSGNLGLALATGCVDLVEHSSMVDYHAAIAAAATEPNFIPQGGAWPYAEPGMAALARAIAAWWRTRPGGGLDVPARLPATARGLDVVLPAATGAAALYLARHLPAGVHVYAVPVKGDAEALRRRMQRLDAQSGEGGRLPSVLLPPRSHAVKFGAVTAALLATWKDATASGVLLDLVYGPVAWGALEACAWRPSGEEGRETLYINTGGHEGLHDQMRRYARAGHLRKLEQGRDHLWNNGQWEVEEMLSAARRVAARTAGLVHTRDAGL